LPLTVLVPAHRKYLSGVEEHLQAQATVLELSVAREVEDSEFLPQTNFVSLTTVTLLTNILFESKPQL
jgi:hypothetical protein